MDRFINLTVEDRCGGGVGVGFTSGQTQNVRMENFWAKNYNMPYNIFLKSKNPAQRKRAFLSKMDRPLPSCSSFCASYVFYFRENIFCLFVA
ncbi:MAG TPA: hypothetical protein VIO58_08055 [Candidatus Methanoperedens sp.]